MNTKVFDFDGTFAPGVVFARFRKAKREVPDMLKSLLQRRHICPPAPVGWILPRFAWGVIPEIVFSGPNISPIRPMIC
jgi:hypothetical protein